MLNSRKYINFINGRYASEGVRITAGIILPSFVMYYFNMLPVGIIMSLGALCVSVADAPGAVKFRVYGMMACNILISAISIITFFSASNIFILGIVIVLAGFIFSMLTVFGNRSSTVGIAALVIMALSLQNPLKGIDIWIHAGYTLAGGMWYMLYSLALYRLRPYKFIQQVLADYISDVGKFLSLRGDLYGNSPDYELIEAGLLQQQINIEAQQNMLSELLFNTRTIVKESTEIGRLLLKNYIELTELHESVMTTYQQHQLMHEQFDETGIMNDFHAIIKAMAKELEIISHAIKTGHSSFPNTNPDILIKKVKVKFENLRKDFMKHENLENFVSLGRVLTNLEEIEEKIKRLHLYTNPKVRLKKGVNIAELNNGFSAVNDIRPSLFFNNLNFKSNIFRHALRVAIALLAGYIVSVIFKVDRGYWVLLTIVVILKPAYAISKIRNYDRLIGTVLGLVLGMLLLFIIKNETVLLVCMIFLMTGSFIFLRTNYFMSVFLMTPYLLIFFHFLYPGILRELMIDRLVDTAIGSAIAYFASLFLVPVWETSDIRTYMKLLTDASSKYYNTIAEQFIEKKQINVTQINIDRRELLIALSNCSNAFNRMLSEPKRHRIAVKTLHQFVVMNHTLSSHLTTLAYLLQTQLNTFRSKSFEPIIKETTLILSSASKILSERMIEKRISEKNVFDPIHEFLESILEKRKTELTEGKLETTTKLRLVETKSVVDQFNYIFNDVNSIYKISAEFNFEMNDLK